MEAVMRLDIGTSRQHQEDHAGAFPELGLGLVADGMGGHSSGIVAATLTVDTVEQSLRPWRGVPWGPGRSWCEHPLVTAILLANLSINEDARQNRSRQGQGSTVAAVQRAGDGVLIAWVGDSRVYRLRGGTIEQLTEDHSLLNEYLKVKPLTPEEFAEVPHNVITRALGMRATVEVDTRYEPLAVGDLFLVCSDGLSSVLDDRVLEEILGRGGPLSAAADALLAEANRRGTDDNVSLVLARWVDAPASR